MKKQMIKTLNEAYAPALVTALQKMFPDLSGIVTSFNLIEGGIVCDYKSQGKVKNREIELFIESFRVGYMAAMEVIVKMD